MLASVFWGANPVAIKIGLLDAPPIRLAALRFVIGGAVILVWAGLTGRLAGVRIQPGEAWPLGVLGLLLAAQIACMNLGANLTSAAHAAVMINLYAVHTVVLAHFLIPGDRLTARRALGVVIAYAGIVMLFARDLATATSTLLGDGLVLASALLLAERMVYLARAVHRVDQVKLLLAQAVLGSLLLLVVSLALEAAPTRWTLRLAGVLAFQGGVVSGFNFAVNLWLLRRYRPTVLAAIFLTQPIFGVIAAALVAGDPLTWELGLASVAVAVGIGLTSR